MSALHVILAFDPGQTGAIAMLADGEFAGFVDMPVMPRASGGHHVDGASMATAVRQMLARHPGATRLAVLERVSAMPKQGVSSVFRFGEGYGVIRGVVGALGIPFVTVPSVTWKRWAGLMGTEKDVARSVAIQRFPAAAPQLQRKKDSGRADALLIGAWAQATEQLATASRTAA